MGRENPESSSSKASKAGIHQVGTVFAPVQNQERALEFFVGKLGFEKRVDFLYGGGIRWVEVAPPGSNHAIALVPIGEGRRPEGTPATICAMATKNIEAEHAKLKAQGVDVDEIGRQGSSRSGLVSEDVSIPDPQPAQFLFRDSEGNRFLVVEY